MVVVLLVASCQSHPVIDRPARLLPLRHAAPLIAVLLLSLSQQVHADALPAGFVRIEAGDYTVPARPEGMRAATKERLISAARAFLLQSSEVTQGEWRALMGANPSDFARCGGDDCPVEGVSWHDAVLYANALSMKEGLESCYVVLGAHVEWPKGSGCLGYRLPTQGEWEYAAHAAAPLPSNGDLQDVAWTAVNSSSSPHPVRTRLPNAWGVYDMLGNVAEWCWDPDRPTAESERVIRGGAWWSWPPEAIELAMRGRFFRPSFAGIGVGFRLARSVP